MIKTYMGYLKDKYSAWLVIKARPAEDQSFIIFTENEILENTHSLDPISYTVVSKANDLDARPVIGLDQRIDDLIIALKKLEEGERKERLKGIIDEIQEEELVSKLVEIEMDENTHEEEKEDYDTEEEFYTNNARREDYYYWIETVTKKEMDLKTVSRIQEKVIDNISTRVKKREARRGKYEVANNYRS